MAIESINFDESFRIKLAWPAGVKGMVIYCVAHGEGLADEEALMSGVTHGGLQRFNGLSYGAGTAFVSYAPQQAALQACWVDICFCDYSMENEVMRHECFGTYFNGSCKIGSRIDLIPISSGRQAVEITLLNKSKFPIQANGIGFSVNGRVQPIPRTIEKGEKVTLPQFDVGIDDTVKLCPLENSYPAEFYKLAE